MKHNPIKLVLFLLSLVGSFVGVLFLAVITGVLGHLLSISVTVLGALGIAKMLGLSIALEFNIIYILLIVCGLMRGVLRYIEQYFNHYIAFKLLAIIRDKVFVVLRELSPAKLEGKKKGDIISMITSDIETLELFYAHTMSPVGIMIIVNIIMIVFVSLVANIYVGLYFMLAYIVIALIVPRFTSKQSLVVGKEARGYFSKFNANYLDQIKGSKELLIYNKTEDAICEVKDSTTKLTFLNKKVSKLSVVSGVLVALAISVLSIGLLVGGIGFELSAGALVVSVVALMSSFGPTIAVAALPNSLTHTFASAGRILDLMHEEPETRDIADQSDFTFEDLQIKDLSFGYDKKHTVLDNLSLELKKGEIVGLIGESGKGKSTILKLLLRFYKVEENKIFYNGVPIEKINTESLKNNVVMVSQSTFLFGKSIRENLLLAKPSATEAEIIEACKCASIYEFIEELPNKLNTIFGKEQDFSFGEKQRIGIARAFLSDANLILLDEPTSNVDVMNEGIILKSIKENKFNKTMLIVSHRESVIKVCSRYIKI